MLEGIRSTLIEVASNAFETMFFMTPEPVEMEEEGQGLEKRETGIASPLFLKSEIRFQGRYSGRLKLYLPYNLAKSMTTDFLGLEGAESSEAQVVDMTGELLNVICGNLFSAYDPQSVCQLALPKTVKMTSLDPEERANGSETSVMLRVLDQKVELKIEGDPEAKGAR